MIEIVLVYTTQRLELNLIKQNAEAHLNTSSPKFSKLWKNISEIM